MILMSKYDYVHLGMVRNEHAECIKPSQCPCMSHGRSYEDGETIKNKCNTW